MSQYYCKVTFDGDQGKEIVFLNTARSTRSGFAHDSTLIVDGCRMGDYTAHYLNRTWEMYRFQTAMLGAIDSAIDWRMERIKEHFKYENKLTRIAGANKEKLQELYNKNETIQLLKLLRDEVNKHSQYMN